MDLVGIEPTSPELLVDLVGIEPTTFPAGRDALTRCRSSYQLLNRAMRLPAFQLPFAPPSLGKSVERFLVNQCPRSSTPRGSGLAALVFRQSDKHIGGTADIVLIRALALENVNCRHRNCWWTWSGSNRRPLPCHGSALPAAPQAHGKTERRLIFAQLSRRVKLN